MAPYMRAPAADMQIIEAFSLNNIKEEKLVFNRCNIRDKTYKVVHVKIKIKWAISVM